MIGALNHAVISVSRPRPHASLQSMQKAAGAAAAPPVRIFGLWRSLAKGGRPSTVPVPTESLTKSSSMCAGAVKGTGNKGAKGGRGGKKSR